MCVGWKGGGGGGGDRVLAAGFAVDGVAILLLPDLIDLYGTDHLMLIVDCQSDYQTVCLWLAG